MIISGAVSIENNTLQSRDAIGVTSTDSFSINTTTDTQLLFIEVPMS